MNNGRNGLLVNHGDLQGGFHRKGIQEGIWRQPRKALKKKKKEPWPANQ